MRKEGDILKIHVDTGMDVHVHFKSGDAPSYDSKYGIFHLYTQIPFEDVESKSFRIANLYSMLSDLEKCFQDNSEALEVLRKAQIPLVGSSERKKGWPLSCLPNYQGKFEQFRLEYKGYYLGGMREIGKRQLETPLWLHFNQLINTKSLFPSERIPSISEVQFNLQRYKPKLADSLSFDFITRRHNVEKKDLQMEISNLEAKKQEQEKLSDKIMSLKKKLAELESTWPLKKMEYEKKYYEKQVSKLQEKIASITAKKNALVRKIPKAPKGKKLSAADVEVKKILQAKKERKVQQIEQLEQSIKDMQKAVDKAAENVQKERERLEREKAPKDIIIPAPTSTHEINSSQDNGGTAGESLLVPSEETHEDSGGTEVVTSEELEEIPPPVKKIDVASESKMNHALKVLMPIGLIGVGCYLYYKGSTNHNSLNYNWQKVTGGLLVGSVLMYEIYSWCNAVGKENARAG